MSPKPEKHDYSEQATNTDAFPDRENRVRSRAYELYVNRSYEPGFDIDDWLLAETEIDGKNRS